MIINSGRKNTENNQPEPKIERKQWVYGLRNYLYFDAVIKFYADIRTNHADAVIEHLCLSPGCYIVPFSYFIYNCVIISTLSNPTLSAINADD
jgi:hypothetical protein